MRYTAFRTFINQVAIQHNAIRDFLHDSKVQRINPILRFGERDQYDKVTYSCEVIISNIMAISV